jgi:hypothetical protein
MKKSYDVVWAERAEKDLRDIVAYIAKKNPTQALKILNNNKDPRGKTTGYSEESQSDALKR